MRKLSFMMMVVLVWMVLPVIAQDESELCFNRGGLIDDETGICKLHALLEINVDYPLEYAELPFAMERLDSVIDTEIQSFMMMFVEADIVPSWSGWGLSMVYSEVRYSETIFTVIFDEYLYTGGAHGTPITYAMTFDTEAETELTLDDVFTDVDAGLALVAPFAVAQVNELLGEYADSDWIATGTAPDDENNYATWALSEEGIIFYFGAYQVAPYAAGTQMVIIPFTDLLDVLEPAFDPSI